jgi:hypothetical protein
MADRYRIILHSRLEQDWQSREQRANQDPNGPEADFLRAGAGAVEVLRDGREAEMKGERLGFSTAHYDLRDCAEIKVPVVQEYGKNGKPLGPSHRMIYREFQPAADDPRPIRQVVGFGERKNGAVFEQVGSNLERSKGRSAEALQELSNTEPALGPKKDPDRPFTPPRLDLPAGVAAALQTTPDTSTVPRYDPRNTGARTSQGLQGRPGQDRGH